ncbi:phospholipase D-like domain-containing protein [Halorubrum gandharaense]
MPSGSSRRDETRTRPNTRRPRFLVIARLLLIGVATLTVALVCAVAISATIASATSGAETGAAGGTPADTPADATGAIAGVVELYPNPTTEGNRGEYLVVHLPVAGDWTLWDGYHEATIPANVTGTVALSADPELTAGKLGHGERDDAAVAGPHPPPVHELDDHFPLSATGDRIELRYAGEPVDTVAYDRVRDGWRWRAGWGEWRPDGYVPRSPRSVESIPVKPFLLPDSPDVPVAPIDTATDRVFVAAYTLESERVADALVAAAERGATVRVVVEGTPVGGFSERGAVVGDRLDAAGVEVRVLDGDPDRFRFHHAKYAVADDQAVVLTENWKRSGTGGRSNRGWGVAVDDSRAADDLAALYRDDAAADDAVAWADYRADADVHESGAANGSYPTRFEPPAPDPDGNVSLLTAPGNAEDGIVNRIDAADDRALAVVPRTDGPDGRIVRALRRAAERGVDARLLVSGEWYDREENQELATALADDPLAVSLAEPRGRYGTLHAKGVVADDVAVVGSLNWNEQAATENREVLLAVESARVADFLARAYAADWRGGGVHLPIGLLFALGVVVAGAGVVARREVEFA